MNQIKQKGFTLVEVIVASSITLIAGTFLVGILVSETGFFYKQNAVINEGINSNDSVQKITPYIKQASAIATGYPDDTPLYFTGQSILVLKLPALTEAGVVIADTYDYVVVAADQQNPRILRILLFPDASSSRKYQNQVLTTFLDSINFKYFDKNGNIVQPVNANSVEVNITIQVSNGSINSKRNSSLTVTLRNN